MTEGEERERNTAMRSPRATVHAEGLGKPGRWEVGEVKLSRWRARVLKKIAHVGHRVVRIFLRLAVKVGKRKKKRGA